MGLLSTRIQPFRGLQSFRFIDRKIYAGRDADIEKLYDLILLYRGVIVYGISGIGKSSLMGAGLIPELIHEGGFSPEIIRVYPSITETFSVKKIRDSETESSYFPSIFNEHWNKKDKRINLSLHDFKSIIKRLGDENQDKNQKTPVLIFDQFEELITYFEEADETSCREEESLDLISRKKLQNDIISFIKTCIYNEKLPIKLIFTFREDYLAKFSALFNAVPDLRDHFLRIKPIQVEKLDEILRKPFEAMTFPNPFSEELITKIKTQFENKYRDNNLDLTEVQIICQQLYNIKPEVRLAKLEEGIDNILKGFLLQSIEMLSENEKAVAIEILSLLVLNEKVRNIYHRDAIFEKLKQQHPEQVIDTVLEKLESKIRIIRREPRKGGTYYEIISEAIIPFINQRKTERENKLKEIENKKRNQKIYAVIIIAFISCCAVVAKYVQDQEINSRRRELEAELKVKRAETAELIFKYKKSEAEAMASQLKVDSQLVQMALVSTEKEQALAYSERKTLEALKIQNKLEFDLAISKYERDLSNKRIVDSLGGIYGSKKLAEKSLKIEYLPASKTTAILAFDTLSKAYNGNTSGVFSPEVYEALTNALMDSIRNDRYFSFEADYKRIESVFYVSGKIYLSRPFASLTEMNGKEIIKDQNLIRCWINESGSLVATLSLNNTKTKCLTIKNFNDQPVNPPIVLRVDEDVLSVLFDQFNETCVYSTRLSGGSGRVVKFTIGSQNDTAEVMKLQKNEYMFLDRGSMNGVIGITNLAVYYQWDNFMTGQAVVKQLAIHGSKVSTMDYAPSTRSLYIGTDNGEIYMLNQQQGFKRYASQENSRITVLSCSNDGHWLAAGSIQNGLTLLKLDAQEASSVNLLKKKSYSPKTITAVCFSSDNDSLIAATSTGYFYCFPLSLSNLANKLCKENISLNRDEWEKYIPSVNYRNVCEEPKK